MRKELLSVLIVFVGMTLGVAEGAGPFAGEFQVEETSTVHTISQTGFRVAIDAPPFSGTGFALSNTRIGWTRFDGFNWTFGNAVVTEVDPRNGKVLRMSAEAFVIDWLDPWGGDSDEWNWVRVDSASVVSRQGNGNAR